ncbi:MAG TPA: copper amine oxidase N-terminal domain-containing protein, partial [Candidatus Paenibacillus intestinavium]|nr:copper amine oxidase N-terminal domain-containing protein [Candidatus Paenibacillus intestinavium]
TIAPFVRDNRTLVPLRFISGVLGADVAWNGKAKSITIKGTSTIVLTEGSTKALVNGKELKLDVAPINIQGTTFIPLRFVNENLGGEINFDSKEGSILVSAKAK